MFQKGPNSCSRNEGRKAGDKVGRTGGGHTELHPADEHEEEIAAAHGEIQEDAIFSRPKQTAPFVMENITKNLSALTKYLWQAGGHW